MGGIEFSGTASSLRSENELVSGTRSGAAAAVGPAEELLSLSTRFAPSTGIVNRREDEERYLFVFPNSRISACFISSIKAGLIA